jgi:hypothetical protein
MATKKQQRRKYRRAQGRGRLHEGYEAQGASDQPKEPRSKEPRKQQPRRGVRQPSRPTWLRSLKRGALFAAGLFLFTMIAPFGGTKPTPTGAAVQAAAFFVFLVPFGYLMDGFIYNRWLKRQQG